MKKINNPAANRVRNVSEQKLTIGWTWVIERAGMAYWMELG